MSIAFQRRRGTTTNHSGFAGLIGELTVDTTKKVVVVHDGSTLGGWPMAPQVHTHTATQVSGLYNQQIQLGGTNQTQQPNVNFTSLFSASNDIVNNATVIGLANNNTTGAGTYGSATQVAKITLNAQGLVTSVTQQTIAGVTPAGTATGDLGGNYPGPNVVTVGGATATNIANTVTEVANAASINTASTLVFRDSGGNFAANNITASLIGNITGNAGGTAASITGNLTGDVTSVGMVTTISASGVTAGTYGNTTQYPKISVNAKGQVTSVTLQTISGVSPGGSAGGDLTGNYPSPTVGTVGGQSAAAVASGAVLANGAVSTNTASEIVLRDGNGAAALTTVTESINLVASSATPTFNLTLGLIQQIVINANITSITLTGIPSGSTQGRFVIFDFVHDSTTTAYTIAFPSNVKTSTSAVGTTANAHNTQLFWCDNTNLYELGQIRTNLI